MLLVVNAGSSSVKLALYKAGVAQLSGGVTEIGTAAARLRVAGDDRVLPVADHAEALRLAFAAMGRAGLGPSRLTAAAHRVVHGGAALTAACRITPAVLAQIEACVPLAPLHNPANLTAIRALAGLVPDLPQFASFDTAFHATNPSVAVAYALPAALREQGIRRYGFHGLSYSGLVRKVQEMAPNGLPKRLLALHLGNGASLCALQDGQSVATTMGYSPLDGLTMGSRSGSIDGNAVLRLAELHGIDGATRILNRESGLLGLGGTNDMRQLHAAGTAEAQFAVAHFCYWATRHAGSMIAAMGGLDGIAFTGGIGENDPYIRAEILRALHWAGVRFDEAANAKPNSGAVQALHENGASVAIWTVPADEEAQIAAEAQSVVNAEGLLPPNA